MQSLFRSNEKLGSGSGKTNKPLPILLTKSPLHIEIKIWKKQKKKNSSRLFLSKPSTFHPSRNLTDYQSKRLVLSHVLLWPIKILVFCSLYCIDFQKTDFKREELSKLISSIWSHARGLRTCLNRTQYDKNLVNTFLGNAKYNGNEKF